jgi:glycosyltransferase involved in cell wall biosynthesis
MATLNSIVFSPPWRGGGIKSLYVACEALGQLGRSTIAPFGDEPRLADWFGHHCQLYDYTYLPDLVVYPEVYQPRIPNRREICFVLGKYGHVEPHADLAVCRSQALVDWVAKHNSQVRTALLHPGIDRKLFEYDGREKRDVICYMTRPHKHPETADLLRERYGDKVVEIVDRSESEVAEILKSAKVFVWRGTDMEGSPRPPKEALVAGCIVVGLTTDLDAAHHTDFGLRCSSIEELLDTAGQALSLPSPTAAERAIIRDVIEEKADWVRIATQLMGS